MKKGDIVVCCNTGRQAGSWVDGNMHKITEIHDRDDNGGYFSSCQGDSNSTGLWCDGARLATAQEAQAYNKGISNIKKIKPETVTNTYQIY